MLEISENIDGLGSNINEYARRALVSSLTYVHSAIMVCYPAAMGARNLAEERAQGRRPYWVEIDPYNIYGWRLDRDAAYGTLTQVRIYEKAVVPEGRFGEKTYEQIRVIEPGRYEVYRQRQSLKPLGPGFMEPNSQSGDYELIDAGTYSLDQIPLVTTYSNKVDTMASRPPLIDVAYLNLAHFQRQADLIHALHIAAMPTLVLEGWDDTSGSATMGVNYAIAMQPGNKAYYVQADATSFDAQMQELQSLEGQMSTLGVTKLFGQKFVAESAEAKRIDQAQSNSVLSIISQELESALNQAFAFAAQYVGIEPPEITIDRDFDYYRLIGQDVSVLAQLNQMGKISDAMLLDILRRGEILPDTTNIESELEAMGKSALEITEPAASLEEPNAEDESNIS